MSWSATNARRSACSGAAGRRMSAAPIPTPLPSIRRNVEIVTAIAYSPSWLGSSSRATTIVDNRPRTCTKIPFAVSRAAPDAARRRMSPALSAGSTCVASALTLRVLAGGAIVVDRSRSTSPSPSLNGGFALATWAGRGRLNQGMSQGQVGGRVPGLAMISRRSRRQTRLPKGSTFHWFSSCWSSPTMTHMRVLLTGSGGYVGTVARGILEAAGHDVVGLDTGLYEDCDLSPLPAPPPPEIRRDVRDVTPADLEGCDAVIHLAALSNDPLGEFDESLTYAINHEASVRLARLARTAGVERFLFASSCSMYGASQWHGARRRDSAPRAADGVRVVQGSRRAVACRVARRTASHRSFFASRPPTVSHRGCASTSCSTTSWVPRWLRASSVFRATALPGGLSIHVEDMARALRSPRSMRPGRPSTSRRSMPVPPRRTTSCGTSRQMVAEVSPGLRSDVRGGCRHRPAQLQGRLLEDRGCIDRVPLRVGSAERRRVRLAEAYRGGLDGRGDVRRRSLHAPRASPARLLAEGRLDDDLRWQEPSAVARRCGVIFTETKLKGAFIIDLERREDDRGFFARASASTSSPRTA